MSSVVCEECWGNAHLRMQDNPQKSQYEHYLDLIKGTGHTRHGKKDESKGEEP